MQSRKNTQRNSPEMDHLEFTTGVIGYPLLFVLLIWIIYWFEIRFGFDFTYLGVQPLSAKGLRGIIFSPFVHGSLEHLYSNSIPLLILSLALFYFYRKISWKVLLFGTILTGFLTWCIAEPYSTHIGASGIIYCLAGFLFFKGIWSKNFRLIALSLIVVFLYGSLVWGILPGKEGISWEGHLSGLISGIILALVYKNYRLPVPQYEWEKDTYEEENDPFMKHFDKDGNFIEFPEAIEKAEAEEMASEEKMEIRYYFKGKSE
ncbi:MAG TPA: rhomboid family intramembrane serine protease [Flavobacteriaceae bacterium]|nr:rhomboid family intramembrane serine protease [Flavobacteriaceae bacterium]